jgi:hypothetical protein
MLVDDKDGLFNYSDLEEAEKKKKAAGNDPAWRILESADPICFEGSEEINVTLWLGRNF